MSARRASSSYGAAAPRNESRVLMADLFLVGQSRRARAAKKRVKSHDALSARRAKDAACDGIAAGHARGWKKDVSDEVEVHAII